MVGEGKTRQFEGSLSGRERNRRTEKTTERPLQRNVGRSCAIWWGSKRAKMAQGSAQLAPSHW